LYPEFKAQLNGSLLQNANRCYSVTNVWGRISLKEEQTYKNAKNPTNTVRLNDYTYV